GGGRLLDDRQDRARADAILGADSFEPRRRDQPAAVVHEPVTGIEVIRVVDEHELRMRELRPADVDDQRQARPLFITAATATHENQGRNNRWNTHVPPASRNRAWNLAEHASHLNGCSARTLDG